MSSSALVALLPVWTVMKTTKKFPVPMKVYETQWYVNSVNNSNNEDNNNGGLKSLVFIR